MLHICTDHYDQEETKSKDKKEKEKEKEKDKDKDKDKEKDKEKSEEKEVDLSTQQAVAVLGKMCIYPVKCISLLLVNACLVYAPIYRLTKVMLLFFTRLIIVHSKWTFFSQCTSTMFFFNCYTCSYCILIQLFYLICYFRYCPHLYG